MRRAVLKGAIYSILSAFPLASVVALVYGFPIPFGKKMSGIEAVVPSLFAVIFYGILGGFVVLGLMGAVAGALSYQIGKPDGRRVNWLCLAFSLSVTLAGVVFLAILDLIIGQW